MNDGSRTVVAVLPDGTELLVKHFDEDVPEMAKWHLAVRDPESRAWGPPLTILRIEEGT